MRPMVSVSPNFSGRPSGTAEYGRIGGNLNQIARTLNEWHSPYPAMAKELREAAADLAALKYEVLKKVGDAVGNTQAFRL